MKLKRMYENGRKYKNALRIFPFNNNKDPKIVIYQW